MGPALKKYEYYDTKERLRLRKRMGNCVQDTQLKMDISVKNEPRPPRRFDIYLALYNSTKFEKLQPFSSVVVMRTAAVLCMC